MSDTPTDPIVSFRMSRVRGKDTRPELVVRRLLHRAGYRYRLHDRRLPGRPDIVFAGRRKVIEVQGCLWHWHEACPNCRLPVSRREFWLPKLEQNRARDKRNRELLEADGWQVLVVWECEMKGEQLLEKRLFDFLEERE